MSEPPVFRRDDVLSHLAEVAEALPAGEQQTVVLVGGALLAIDRLRAATLDVDVITPLSPTLQAAVQVVAGRHGLPAEWLNDRASGFRPRGLDLGNAEVLFNHPRLRVVAPPRRAVFLMKLMAARPIDHDDMVALWPLTGYDDADQVVDEFYEAYPHEERDPYLAGYVRQIAREAT